MTRRRFEGLACALALLGLLALAGVAVASPRPDPVVLIEVSSSYRGVLWGDFLGGSVSGSGFVLDLAPVATGGAPGACAALVDGGLAIVTNEHVARSPREILITFMWEGNGGDVRQFAVPARLLAADQRTDLALLRVEAADLRARGLDPDLVPRLRLSTGEQSALQPGTAVQALGNPQGLKRVVTAGVVSAAQQLIPGQAPMVPPFRLVQTDTAINSGNSGGPLVLAGTDEVVGVNFFGGAQNLNFAIPAQRVRTFLEQAACRRGVRHGFVPVLTEPVDEKTRSVLDLEQQAGEIVLRRIEGLGFPTPALLELDVVLGVTGTRQPEAGGGSVTTAVGPGGAPLSEALFDLEPGSDAVLRVLRERQPVDVTVRVEPLDIETMFPEEYLLAWGAYFEDVPWRTRVQSGYGGPGVVCGGVLPGSLAADAGVDAGDVVSQILVRDASGLHEHAIADLRGLAAAVVGLEAAFAQARAGHEGFTVAFKIYQLEARAHGFRIARVGASRSEPPSGAVPRGAAPGR